MTEQTFIQLRMDSSLKQSATDILNDLGMDMPNAIRMFLKRIVIERGLPFDAKLASTQEEAEHAEDGKSVVIYTPAKSVKIIPLQEYIDLLCKVPAGKITRLADIEHHLEKRYTGRPNGRCQHIQVIRQFSTTMFGPRSVTWRYQKFQRGSLNDSTRTC